MAETPLYKKITKRVSDASSAAYADITSRERRDKIVGAAVRHVQDARHILDKQADRAINSLGLASRGDVERVSLKIGRVRKRLTRLISSLRQDAAQNPR